MKPQAIVIGSYALLNLIGGIIGFAVAGSLTSIVASAFIAVALLLCAWYVLKGNQIAYQIAFFLTLLLIAFFSYRYFLSWKIAPGGIMALISCSVLLYLGLKRAKISPL